ncbi:glycosyltransferase family 2 protein [Geoalkalibacter subterraneus]|uniref:glycosyltransferase family 2 protein n=1 Tax=Geoalkalibacter subterraneus TaxID=483547 RepID=UPI0006949D6F|nr:glycosyltransferase family 2 protein [Geoalkalibacter subterraneus]
MKYKVSVVMPVYNSEKYLRPSVESILNQTFQDFEFIIINDGSTDSSGTILKEYSKSDQRIKLIEQENKGIVSALNFGFEMSDSEYVIRMDSDDISMPYRIEHQLKFMDSHPGVGASSSVFEVIDEFGELVVTDKGELFSHCSSEMLAWSSLFTTVLCHPGSIIRKDVFSEIGGYRKEFQYIEDHDLWLRISSISKLAITSEPLIKYRHHGNNLSTIYGKDSKNKNLHAACLYDFLKKNDLNSYSFEDCMWLWHIYYHKRGSNLVEENPHIVNSLARKIILLYKWFVENHNDKIKDIKEDVVKIIFGLMKSSSRCSYYEKAKLLSIFLRFKLSHAF